MDRLILRILRLMLGYSLTGVGLLILLVVTKFLVDVFPQILGLIIFGIGFVVLGLLIVGKKN